MRWLYLGSVLFSLRCLSAEPEVKPDELPRIRPTEPGKALATFKVKSRFRLELAAAEPNVRDPVAIAFDENGRMFVIEMRDYSERRDERLGTVRLLEDADNDGKFEKSTVFADGLPWPTAVICYGGGVFVATTPDILFLRDTNGDGKADERRIVFTGFGKGVERLNVQALPNSFNWTLDNRIHGAAGPNGGQITRPDAP
jgi:putative membrane-bound dehydrogenase-like protein